MSKPMHPTRERLILTTVSLMDGEHPDKVQVEEVLTASGISRGSLYHHFEDFSDLIEAALVYRFAETVDESISTMSTIVFESHDREEFTAALRAFTAYSQDPSRSRFRFERARALGMAGTNERFRASLGREQQRLTDAMTDVVREAAAKGWVRSDLDPRAIAVLLQAYTLGRVVDDVVPEPMDSDAWTTVVDALIQRALV